MNIEVLMKNGAAKDFQDVSRIAEAVSAGVAVLEIEIDGKVTAIPISEVSGTIEIKFGSIRL
jgi:hypothetical protein